MKYWRESFGFIAVVSGVAVLIAGHILIWLIDGRLRRNLVIRLREKARSFELKHGASMLREDGLFLKPEVRSKFTMKGGTVASTKKVFKEGEDAPEEQKEGPIPAEGEKKKKKVQPMKKRVFEDEDDSDSSSDDEELVKNLKLGDGGAEDDEAIKAQMDALRKEKEEKKRLEDEADGLFDSESEEERDLSALNHKQLEQYERHKKVVKNLKDQRYPHNLYHELMIVRLDEVEGMT